MQKPTKLAEVRNDRKRAAAKELRADMFSAMRNAAKDSGDEIACYAIVVWDKDGCNHSTFRSGGPIQSRLVPAFAGDALTQHVTIDLVLGRR